MCTVSIVPSGDVLRIACNRDERRTRPPALPPRITQIGQRQVLFPIDPVSHGTWIGVNDNGVAFALLNRSLDGLKPAPRLSRGTIVPALLEHARLSTAVEQAMSIDASFFEPFRLVGLQAFALVVISSDGRRLSRTYLSADRPLLFTSSSMGDRRVQIPRGVLFDRLVVNARCGWGCGQYLFHRHRWVRRPEISVVMSRPDARTVSRTVIDVARRAISMRYEPLVEAAPAIEHWRGSAA